MGGNPAECSNLLGWVPGQPCCLESEWAVQPSGGKLL